MKIKIGNIKNEYLAMTTLTFAVIFIILLLYADMPGIFEFGPYVILISASLLYPSVIIIRYGLKLIVKIVDEMDNSIKLLVSFLIAFYFVSTIMNIFTFHPMYGLSILNSIFVLHLILVQEMKSIKK